MMQTCSCAAADRDAGDADGFPGPTDGGAALAHNGSTCSRWPPTTSSTWMSSLQSSVDSHSCGAGEFFPNARRTADREANRRKEAVQMRRSAGRPRLQDASRAIRALATISLGPRRELACRAAPMSSGWQRPGGVPLALGEVDRWISAQRVREGVVEDVFALQRQAGRRRKLGCQRGLARSGKSVHQHRHPGSSMNVLSGPRVEDVVVGGRFPAGNRSVGVGGVRGWVSHPLVMIG